MLLQSEVYKTKSTKTKSFCTERKMNAVMHEPERSEAGESTLVVLHTKTHGRTIQTCKESAIN